MPGYFQDDPTAKQYLITSSNCHPCFHTSTFPNPFASCTALVSFSTTKLLEMQHLLQQCNQSLLCCKEKQDPNQKSIQTTKGPKDLVDNMNIRSLVKYKYFVNYMDIEKAMLFSTSFY